MTQATTDRPGLANDVASPHPAMVGLGVVGLAASIASLWVVQPLQFNVVTYEVVRSPTGRYLPSVIFASVILFGIVAAAFAAVRACIKSPLPLGGEGWVRGKIRGYLDVSPSPQPSPLKGEGVLKHALRPCPARKLVARTMALLPPMILGSPLAAYGLSDVTPPFPVILLFVFGCGWTAYLAGRRLGVSSRTKPVLAIASLAALIALFAVVHTRIQINFFDHFMMGHADVGHFTEELKNALAGRGLRSDSFDNTRLGWHFVPLLYVLVPGYALWPSPVYLMACGALVLHAAALPAYWLAQRRTGSVLTGWLCGLAWILLPSISRMVYSNTYGFAWLYCSVPILAALLAAAELRRWKACWIMVAVLLLCRETNAAATFGFGLYLALFSSRRRAGLVVALVSIVYALLCAAVLIPSFAAAGRYERLDLFGELGNSLGSLAASAFTKPGVFFARLFRLQGLNLVLLLLTTMFFLPVRGWRLSLAALPTLLPLFLLQNPDWSSIKFWHHAMVLPFLFFAGLAVLRRGRSAGESSSESGSSGDADKTKTPSFHRGAALAVLVCAAWGHYFFGFSPLSKSYEAYANDEFLQNPDPRLAFVERLRTEIPRDRTILATERMAAHFTDYRRLYTGRRARPTDLVIIDQGDRWDTSGLPQRAEEFATHPDYRVHSKFDATIVFERRADAPSPSAE
ncbi:MAG: DUF2079 domain-containing protein [Phycisphaerales bacterium]|nr:DUF2079 domain-containing protein [Phycisphaerales bacterium]